MDRLYATTRGAGETLQSRVESASRRRLELLMMGRAMHITGTVVWIRGGLAVATCCLALVLAGPAASGAKAAAEVDGAATVEDDKPSTSAEAGHLNDGGSPSNPVETRVAVEEVVVEGERVTGLTASERREIYEQLVHGRRLYSNSEYERAFPFLLNTARYGFKGSQARVGYIFLKGLGQVPRDARYAVGWLGVAASGNTEPEIENFFNHLWRRIPERYVPQFEEVVEQFESRYGEDATDVTCELRRPAGSHIKSLACFFNDDLTVEQSRLINEMLSEAIIGDWAYEQPDPTPVPVVTPPTEETD